MCLRAGDIGDVLQAASVLPRLTKMDFTNQFLTGTLPVNISLPSLEELILVNNDITVRLSRPFNTHGIFVFTWTEVSS